jgi:trk system potassium uptake protein TrkH
MSDRRLTATQSIALGFALIILTGALLLMLPVSNRTGATIPFLNALFTSTSATCVTGLVVYDTWSQFTLFGQIIIMLLIQIGGLGFMTVAVLFFFAVKKRIGLRERSFLTEAVSSVGWAASCASEGVLLGTLIFESLGALLWQRASAPARLLERALVRDIPLVSAFCNAGST